MSHLQDEHGRAHSRGELPLDTVVGRITENRRRNAPPPPRPKDVLTFERRTTKVVLKALDDQAIKLRAQGQIRQAIEIDRAINDIRRQMR